MAELSDILSKINSGYTSVTDAIPDMYYFNDYANSYYVDCTNLTDYPRCFASCIQSDGKVIAGGSRYDDSGINRIVRFNTDGTVDETFTSPSFSGNVYAIAIQSDGKIVVGGYFDDGVDENSYYALVRLDTDGSIDGTFNNSIFSQGDEVYAIAVDASDDSLIIGGDFSDYLMKTDVDGVIDSDFATNISGLLNNNVNSLALDSNKDALCVGDFTNYIVKIKTTGTNVERGTVVGTFNIGGGFNNITYAVAIQSDDKILVGGRFDDYDGNSVNQIVRLNSNGGYDSSFALDGALLSPSFSSHYIKSIAIQSDGKVVVGGSFWGISDYSQRRIVRLTTSGAKDTSFDIGYGFNDTVNVVLVDASNNVYCGGYFTQYNKKAISSLFNFACEDFSCGFIKLNSSGVRIGNPKRNKAYCVGIVDGGYDMYDDGNFINTDLTQTFEQIYDLGRDVYNCIPNTHTSALTDTSDNEAYPDFENNDNEPIYPFPPMDGEVVDGSALFGGGSKYFTNMYPGLFVLGAKDISIEEFNITGETGQDGYGDYSNGVVEVTVNGKIWSCFYRSTFNQDSDEPALNQIIIVEGVSEGITQDLGGDPTDSDDHVLTGLTGRTELFYLVFGRFNTDATTENQISEIATKFLQLVTSPEVIKSCSNKGCGTQKGFVCLRNNGCTCAKWKFFTAQCSRNQQALGLCSGISGAYVPAITVCNLRLF